MRWNTARHGRDKPGHDSVRPHGGNKGLFMSRLFAVFLFTFLLATPSYAAQCGGDFNTFLSAMGREAQAAGVSRAVIDQAFVGVSIDQNVLAFDRRQRGTFRKSFEEYASTRVIPARINRARSLMQKNAQLLARIERQYGVPKELLMAIWTLESDNGTGDMGKLPVVRTIATLAHVYGGDEYPWAYEDGVRIKLVPEKKLYQPGETARVLVLSPIEGTALVTVEREKVLRSFMCY